MRGIVSTGSTAPGDGGNDRDLVAVLERGLLRLEEPDVLLVDIDVDEAPELARLVHESFLQPGELAFQVVHQALARVARGLASGVLRPLPLMQMTIDSVRWITPASMSFLAAARVTPPAVSVKMPSVRASNSIPSTISSSVVWAP